MASTEDSNVVDARPISEGKDPLAEGNTLINPSNTEEHNTYEVLETSEGVRQAEKNVARMAEEYHVSPKPVAPRIPVMPNKTQNDLAQATKDRKGR